MVDGNAIAAIARANLGKMYDSINSAGGKGYSNPLTEEPWCADFAKWVWSQAGVNVTGLTAGAITFARYGELGGSPQVGDAVVFGVSADRTYAQHVAIVVEVQGGDIYSIGGDEGSGNPPQNKVQQDGPYPWALGPSSYMGMPISGYVQPRGLVTPVSSAHPPAVAVSGDGAVHVFWRGLAGALWQGTGPGSGDLKGTRLGSGPMESGPAAGVDGQGRVYVYWTGTDGNLWEVAWNGSAWQEQANRGYGPLGSAPAVAVSSGGYASVFWRGTGGALWQAAGQGGGALKGPTRLGFGPMATGPAAGVDGQGRVYVYWAGTDGNLWEVCWDGSAWQGQFNRGYGQVG